MPFTKTENGNWEFDSDRLTNQDGGLVGGFFPDIMYTGLNSDGSTPNYNTCNQCRNTNDISCSPTITFSGTKTWRGVTYSGLDAYDRTYMSNGDLVSGGNNTSFGSCIRSPSGVYPLRNNSSVSRGNNQFCFESHAKFTYNGGEEFIFRGDDDIWVFINNKLVIDLGGTHRAAPGYVDLDTITAPALVRGNEYDIDIFFCDRRSTESNVRISTNMYITQENGLFTKGSDGVSGPAQICLNKDDGGTCAAVATGGGAQELCGSGVGYMLDYFVVNRRGDVSYPLDASQSYCSATNTANEILCFGGIRINTQEGTVRVVEGAVQGLTGTQIVKAKVKDSYAQTMNPVPDPIEVARFVVRTTLEMVWGTVRNETQAGPVLYDGCHKTNSAVTGMLVPICVAGGSWSDGSKTTYLVEAESSRDIPFTFSQAGLFDGSDHAYLQMYFDSLGHRKVPTDSMFTIPSNGLLVLWVTGGYEQLGETHEYTINVAGRSVADAVTLISRLPYLRWTNSDGTVLAAGKNKGSKDSTGGFVPVWISERLTRYLEAYDPATSSPCTVCAFDLRATAKASGLGGDLPETDGELISFNNLKRPDGGVVNGKATIIFSGKVKVEGSDYARIIIRGPSDSDPASIYWDSLQFKEPPVPYPTDAFLFDSNGDGIGDSLRIVYSRGFDKDSLPNMIEVSWGDTTFHFGIGQELNGEYVPPDKVANLDWWKPKLRKSSGSKDIEDRDSTHHKDGKLGIRDTIVISGVEFSKDIRTRGEGSILSWSTFEEVSAGGTPVKFNLGSNMDIQDRMPAIIVSAKYEPGDERNCGGSSRTPCSDRVTLTFSEPVVAIEGVTEQQSKNPFAYMLRNRGRDIFDTLNLRHLPKYMKWRTGGNNIVPVAGGDTSVTLTFDSYRADGDTTNTPIAGDSVKFAVLSVPVLEDLAGNRANPREIGRQIEGRNRFAADKIAIGSLDPGSGEAALRDSIKSVFDEYKIKKDAASLFLKHPIEVLPYPDGWTARDIGVRYPGTVGLALKPDIANPPVGLSDDIYRNIPDSAITFHIRSFYHTNLGDYVVSRELPVIRCNDDIFPVDEKTGRPSCRASKSGVYVAWNLKDAKGRWVGAGAYVGMHDFRWEVNFKDADVHSISDKIERQIDMFGVRRIKAK
jgi:fibro-slime domain-containing protein